MKLVKIDPPGSWCQYEAVLEMIHQVGGKTFLEVGCGPGSLSARLCRKGLHGLGIDFSATAIAEAEINLEEFIRDGRYRLIQSDLFDVDLKGEQFEVGLSMMVMEHVPNQQAFVKRIVNLVKPGGHIIVGVPGRRDRWGIEDETVGHLRRYDRGDLMTTLQAAGLSEVTVWSVAVPVANMLFHAGNFFIRNSSEVDKLRQSDREQTEASGVREIPWKTIFPSSFKLLLNRTTLYPLFVLQRFFYRSNLGLTMIGCGKVG